MEEDEKIKWKMKCLKRLVEKGGGREDQVKEAMICNNYKQWH
jgi:hypothetical protein